MPRSLPATGRAAIVGCSNTTEILSTGQLVATSCSRRGEGIVYRGNVPFSKLETDLSNTKGENAHHAQRGIANMAFLSHLPNAGVGLAGKIHHQ